MKYKRNCRTCQLSKGNAKLRERIVHAKFRHEAGDETLTQIAGDLGISGAALQNHARKHITEETAFTLERKKVRGIEKVKVRAMKEMEVAFDHSDVVAELDFERGLREVVAEGITRLEKGEITVSTTQLLQAIKIKADYEGKKRGQDTELIKTMYKMATNKDKNGNTNGHTDTGDTAEGERSTPAAGEVDTGRAGRPDDLHYEAPWDALARGATSLPQGNSAA